MSAMTKDGPVVHVVAIDAYTRALRFGKTGQRNIAGGTFSSADAAVLISLAEDCFSFEFEFLCVTARKLARTEKLTVAGVLAARQAELEEPFEVPARMRHA